VYQDVVDSLPYVDNDLEAIPGASAAPARLERRRRRRPSSHPSGLLTIEPCPLVLSTSQGYESRLKHSFTRS
jgi:hypothetical protein